MLSEDILTVNGADGRSLPSYIPFIYRGGGEDAHGFKGPDGAFIFTVVEFFVGILVNLIYKWDVWDYSHKPFNILGQVCPEYSFKWFLLCLALLGASSVLRTLWSLLRIRRVKRKNKEEGREADMEIPAFK